MADTYVTLRLRAPNDTSGNPRRCFLVWDQYGNTVDCIDEEYNGKYAYQTKYPGAAYLGDLDVSVKTYRESLKNCKR